MINSRRLLTLLLLIQLICLVILTQSWFQISMEIDRKINVLGDFDAIASYPVAMPISLLSCTAIFIAFLLQGLGRRIVLVLLAAISTLSMSFLGVQILSRDVSGLDGQLEKLTGIAKTHGVEGLSTQMTFSPWIWLAFAIISSSLSIYLAIRRQDPSSIRQQPKKTDKSAPRSSIELWERQRD